LAKELKALHFPEGKMCVNDKIRLYIFAALAYAADGSEWEKISSKVFWLRLKEDKLADLVLGEKGINDMVTQMYVNHEFSFEHDRDGTSIILSEELMKTILAFEKK